MFTLLILVIISQLLKIYSVNAHNLQYVNYVVTCLLKKHKPKQSKNIAIIKKMGLRIVKRDQTGVKVYAREENLVSQLFRRESVLTDLK